MDYDKILNPVVTGLKPSGIRKFFSIAEEMDDVISLGVGEPDFKTPWHIREAGIRSLQKGKTRYTSNAGLIKLREEIDAYMLRRFGLTYGADQTMITVGGSEAIDACIRAVVKPGDEVIIPDPCFVCYDPITRLSGGVPVPIETRAEDGFKITPNQLKEKITDKTKLLILPYPNNPTGAVMRREDLEAIAPIIEESGLFVLSDEIYAELTYGGQRHVSVAGIGNLYERTVVVGGFSKAYSMTGWRLGFACGPEPVISQMVKIHQFAIMCAPSTAQYAGIEAMQNGDGDIAEMRSQYDMRRRFIVNGFNDIGLDCFEPEGAFYVFPSIKKTGLTSEEFCEKLIYSKKVAVVPGTAFGKSGEGYIRVSYCYSIEHIKEALGRIKDFLEELGC